MLSTEFYVEGIKDGDWKTYFSNGNIIEEKHYTNNIEDGLWKQYYANGKKKMTANYVNGKIQGNQYYYTITGKKMIVGHFKDDVRDGEWTFYQDDGVTVKKIEHFKNGYRIDKNQDDDLIKEDTLLHEKQDYLEFEDLLPPQSPN